MAAEHSQNVNRHHRDPGSVQPEAHQQLEEMSVRAAVADMAQCQLQQTMQELAAVKQRLQAEEDRAKQAGQELVAANMKLQLAKEREASLVQALQQMGNQARKSSLSLAQLERQSKQGAMTPSIERTAVHHKGKGSHSINHDRQSYMANQHVKKPQELAEQQYPGSSGINYP